MEIFTGIDYLAVLTEQYGGANKYYSDRYVFNSQEGNGWGSALSSLGSLAMPVLRKVVPFLKTIGRQAIKGGVEHALGKATEKVTKTVTEKVSKKRKKPHRSHSKHSKSKLQ